MLEPVTRFLMILAVWAGMLHPACEPFARAEASPQGDARFQMPDTDLFAGAAFRIYARVVDATEHQAPVVPEIPGATVEVQALESSSSSIIRNGRTTRSSTVTYAIDITPENAGKLTIPAISITVDGKVHRTQPTTVVIKKSDSSDVFDAEVFGTPPEVFIGQPLELVLRIAIKPYRDPSIGVLNEAQMWQLMDPQGSEWGVFLPALQRMGQERREVPPVQTERRDGVEWYVYELTRTIWPPKSGTPDLGSIVVRMKYPLGLREVAGIWGNQRQLMLAGSRPVSAEARAQPMRVLALPEAGKPEGFSGAVGQYSVTATAKPVDVAVGDPVSLTLTIMDRTSGESNLDTLQPPALADVAALKADFRVPSEPLSGTVAGRRKSFMQTIRPLRADVTEIPPIPFSYFDPIARSYHTVATEPIAITVRPATHMDLSRIERVGGSEAATNTNPATQLTELDAGLLANKPVTMAMVTDHGLRWSAALIVALAGPPLAVGGAALWRLNRNRHQRDAGLARRSRARRTAQRRLETAQDATAIGRAVSGYVEDRLGRAEGTMTEGDVRSALEAQGISSADLGGITALLAECNRAIYAGGSAAAEAGTLKARAAAALDALERHRWVKRHEVHA